MLNIRPATEKDRSAIARILDEADLRYKKETFDSFYLAESDGIPAGIVRLEEHDDFVFLTSLGAANGYIKKGIGRALMEYALISVKKDLYLYTVIPDFFAKFGFRPCIPPKDLPPKESYGCDECFPGRCVCMTRKMNAS